MTFATQLTAAFTPIDAVYDADAVTRALSFAQSEVEGYCNRTFDVVTDDIAYCDISIAGPVILPRYPVTAITLVEGFIFSNWVELTRFYPVLDTGIVYPLGGETWPVGPGTIRVTFDHGYTTVPQGLIDVACRLAQQYLENPALMMQRRVAEQDGRFAGSKGVVFTELDERILGRYVNVEIG